MAYTVWSVSQDEVPNAAKWNQLGGNDAHFYSFLGDNLEWQSYTTTVTNMTVGNSTKTAYYTRIGNTVFVRIRFIVGSTATVSAIAVFSLPVTAHADYTANGLHQLGYGYIEDVGVTGYNGVVQFVTTTTVACYAQNSSGTYVGISGYSTTIPFTWGTGDFIEFNFWYEAA